MAQELTPEIDAAVLESIKARVEQERLRQIAQAKGAATARGLGGSSFQAVQEGMANQGASRSLADSMATMALERAKLQREERLIGEERSSSQAFQSSESALGRSFSSKEAELARKFQAQQALVQRDFEANQNRKQRRSDMVGAGLGAAGSGLGIFLCFTPDTPIEMADGSKKAIKDILLGDQTRGGKVFSVRYAEAPDEMFSYLGVKTTGVHAVNENGKWIRVKDSRLASPVEVDSKIVLDLGTTDHRIWINGIEFADDFETDKFFDFYDKPSLDLLNTQKVLING